MSEIGIRELKQNASAVIARAEAGDALTVTRRGKAVARIVPITRSRLEELRDAGLLTEPTLDPTRGPAPRPLDSGEVPPSRRLAELRDDERY